MQQKSASQSRSRSHAKHCKSTKWSLPAAQCTAMKWYISSCCMQKIFRYVAEFKMVRMMLNVGPPSSPSSLPIEATFGQGALVFLLPDIQSFSSLRFSNFVLLWGISNLDNFLFCSEADRSPVLHKHMQKSAIEQTSHSSSYSWVSTLYNACNTLNKFTLSWILQEGTVRVQFMQIYNLQPKNFVLVCCILIYNDVLHPLLRRFECVVLSVACVQCGDG